MLSIASGFFFVLVSSTEFEIENLYCFLFDVYWIDCCFELFFYFTSTEDEIFVELRSKDLSILYRTNLCQWSIENEIECNE